MKKLIRLVKQYRLSLILLILSLSIMNYLIGSVCISVLLFGIPCPACGITRAAKLMAAGHFHEAFVMHPLLILVITGVFLYLLLKSTMQKYKLFMNIYIILTISVFVLFYFYRMQNYFPGAEPMVYRRDNLLARVLTIIRYMKH